MQLQLCPKGGVRRTTTTYYEKRKGRRKAWGGFLSNLMKKKMRGGVDAGRGVHGPASGLLIEKGGGGKGLLSGIARDSAHLSTILSGRGMHRTGSQKKGGGIWGGGVNTHTVTGGFHSLTTPTGQMRI